ncbi:MAG: ribonuclease R [Saprospiraceae bacterium]|nr:ribonuclease R [Saprospiraceae bacterium]
MGKKKKKRKMIKGQKLDTRTLQREVLRYLRQNASKPLSARQLIKRLKIANDKNSMTKALKQLVKANKVQQTGGAYFATGKPPRTARREETHTGVVDMTRSGDAYIVIQDKEDDVYVRGEDLAGAMHGDTVEVVVRNRNRRRPDGYIKQVVKRATDHFIGTYYEFKKYSVVSPERVRVPFDIIVELENTQNANHGDKVVVQVIDWSGRLNGSPEGRITVVLGQPGSSDIEMQSLLLQNGFNVAFPDDVLQEAAKLPDAPTEEDKRGRRDFRDIPTFTIDPGTAKDFDDALSIRKLDNGQLEIGIHIADVTHFVRPGTAIDKEAYRRSTSVYLVDRVAPMLPEELSNALCSLRPEEESLCFSAVFTLDDKHNVRSRWFGKTVIYSDRRFTYEEAQEVIESREGDFAEELHTLNTIAHKMRKDRLRNGALMFETDEVQFVLDEHGVPVELYVKERKDAHLLVEDFMLLANKEVAKFIGETRKDDRIPFVYRVHDLPDPDKVAELAMFAREFDIHMKIDTPKQIAQSFNHLAKAARDNEALHILEPLAIRCMAKAEYNIDNIGHYGLAFDFYTHFTSPIRRYSDVLVHRILHENIDGRTKRHNPSKLQDQCRHISDMERKAQQAERDSIKYKQAEFMQQFVGETMTGYVSGMIDRGLFVKLEATHAEGLAGFERFDEPFELTPSGLSARGKRSGTVYKMGDKVDVRILDADPGKRQIEMEMVGHAK